MKTKIKLLTLACLAICHSHTQAEGLRLSGFGTLGAIYSAEKNADFATNIRQPNGSGFTRPVDYGTLAVMGAQADYEFNEQWSGTLQIKSMKDHDNGFNPKVSLAQINYKLDDHWKFQFGRLALPAYPISDYISIGYSLPWVYAPTEMYFLNHVTHYTGASATYKTPLANGSLTAQVFTGKIKQSASPDIQFEGHGAGGGTQGLTLTFEKESSTWRFAHMEGKHSLYTNDTDGPGGAYEMLRTLPSNFGGDPSLADLYQVNKKRVFYTTLGYTYDPGNYFVMMEYAKLGGEVSAMPHTSSFYLTGGCRINQWTPYITYGKTKTDNSTSSDNPIMNMILSSNAMGQQSLSIGARWDFRKNMDLKFQLQHVDVPDGNRGSMMNTQSSFKPGHFNVISTAVDFVF